MVFDDQWGDPLLSYLSTFRNSRTAQRGLSYAYQRRVLELTLDGPEAILGTVQGSYEAPYNVALELTKVKKQPRLVTACDCPVGEDCKHAYALALVLAAYAVQRRCALASRLSVYFPRSWQRTPPPISAGNQRSLAPLFTSNIQSPPAETKGRKPSALRYTSFESPHFTRDELRTLEILRRNLSVREPILGLLGMMASGRRKARPQANIQPIKPWWMHFVEADTPEKRAEIIRPQVVAAMGARSPQYCADEAVRRIAVYPNPVAGLRQMDSTIKSVRWRYSAQTAESEIEPELAAFLQSDESGRIELAIERKFAQRQLIAWLKSARTEAAHFDASVEVRWLTRRASQGSPRLWFQLLLTSRRHARAARSARAIQQLDRDLQSKKRRMSELHSRMTRWIASLRAVSSGSYGYGVSASDRDGILPVDDAIRWMSLWGGQDLIFWHNNEPVEFAPSSARLTLLPGAEGTLEWGVLFPNSEPSEAVRLSSLEIFVDGTENEQGILQEGRAYARRGNAFYRLDIGEMPLNVFAGLLIAPEMPKSLVDQHGVGNTLIAKIAPRGARSEDRAAAAAALVPLVRQIPVRPVMELRLDGEGGLSLVSLAQAEDGRCFNLRQQGEWKECDLTNLEIAPTAPAGKIRDKTSATEDETALSPVAFDASDSTESRLAEIPGENPGESPHAIVDMPRSSDVIPMEAWLEELIPEGAWPKDIEGGKEGPFFHANPEVVANLLRLWPKRPANVTYLANRAFKNLVTVRSAPSLSVDIKSSGMNWFEIDVRWEDELDSLPFETLLAELDAREGELVILPGGRVYRREDLGKLRDKMRSLADLGLQSGQKGQRLHAAHLAGGAGDSLLELSQSEPDLLILADCVRNALKSFQGIPAAAIDTRFQSILRPYQTHGADFLVWTAKTFGGALLADEMGLGKTVQLLAALSALAKAPGKRSKPSLVVCPASVAHNWEREAHRFAPNLRVHVLASGSGRQEVLSSLSQYDLLVTNYALLRRDAPLLSRCDWLMICADEVQAIKNPGSETAKIIKTLRADYRFALTGTPIENRIGDLESIMSFALPGYLPRMEDLDRMKADAGREASLRLLRARLRPVLLRRLKSEVAPELPPRIEERRDCVMTPKQKQLYLAEVKKTRMLLEGIDDRALKSTGRIQILAALMRMRQICCDPRLIGVQNAGSGKTDALVELLGPIIENGHKTLVFSQFVTMLDLLRTRLEQEGIPFHYLTGQSTNRGELVSKFEHDPRPCVFLISLKAGGTGLNLVSASHVVIFDPWWNPAVEAQAIDRTHRIGQDKTVIACRLVTEGTIEERILELQERKRTLIRGVLEEESFNRMLTRDDFEFLLSEGSAEPDLEEIPLASA